MSLFLVSVMASLKAILAVTLCVAPCAGGKVPVRDKERNAAIRYLVGRMCPLFEVACPNTSLYKSGKDTVNASRHLRSVNSAADEFFPRNLSVLKRQPFPDN